MRTTTNSNLKKWYNEKGQLHRDNDLPAAEWFCGDKYWYVNGLQHRSGDLPAVEYADGSKEWYVNGLCHRDDNLPALERNDGEKMWMMHGEFHRNGGLPAIELANGDKQWYVNGKFHRDGDLPTIEKANGTKQWYIDIDTSLNGKKNKYSHLCYRYRSKLHRLAGPAMEFFNGSKRWFIYDIEYTYDQVCNYYEILKRFGRHCLKKFRLMRIKRLKIIHGQLLCMPPKGNYSGGQDYKEMVKYFAKSLEI